MLIFETGAGLPDAESYASVAAADARCASNFNAAFSRGIQC
ncbi:DnaT-like ssDNA-binding protein [Janthinobacterium agaricidamnosum]|nr:DnaT-like ssDNA-binding protein [Janthinobacterium agaricidamnosum]